MKTPFILLCCVCFIITAQLGFSERVHFDAMQPIDGLSYYRPGSLTTQLDEFMPESIGYQYFMMQGRSPHSLYKDVCPAKHETTWYAIDAKRDTRLTLSIRSEVEALDGEEAFSTNYVTMPYALPVYIGFCAYSNQKGNYRRTHKIAAVSVRNTQISCTVLVNNSGNRYLLSQASKRGYVSCFGERSNTSNDYLATNVNPAPTLTQGHGVGVMVATVPEELPETRFDPFGLDRNCHEFKNHQEAQTFYIAAGGPERDVHLIDIDRDGIACESLL